MTDTAAATPERLRPVTFAASTGHGMEYGVGFYAEDDVDTDGGAGGDCYGDLITMVDERNDAPPARIERAQAETMAFAEEICRRWNAHAAMLAALEAITRECVMVQRHWGDGNNAKAAREAEEAARAAIAQARGGEAQ